MTDQYDDYTPEKTHKGRFAFDDGPKRFFWNVFAVIGILTVLAVLLAVLGVVTAWNVVT